MLQVVGIELLFLQHSPVSQMSNTCSHYTLRVPGVSFTTSGISSASGLVGLGRPLLAKAAVDTYKCIPMWTFLFWIPFLVQVTSHRSITVCHTVVLDLSTSSQQLAVSHHTVNTQLLYTSSNKIWKLSKIVLNWCHYCLNIVNDRNNLRET
jgi:hypothetical protein